MEIGEGYGKIGKAWAGTIAQQDVILVLSLTKLEINWRDQKKHPRTPADKQDKDKTCINASRNIQDGKFEMKCCCANGGLRSRDTLQKA